MKPTAQTALAILSKTPIPVLLIVVFVLGYTFKGLVSTAPRTASTGAVEESSPETGEEIWTCSMHPQIRLPEPGPCPLCGMDLIRAEESSASKTTKKPKREPKYDSLVRTSVCAGV